MRCRSQSVFLQMQILGEGTFGCVKLLVNRESGKACAVKEINLRENPEAKEAVKKEICVQKLVSHVNVVRYRVESGNSVFSCLILVLFFADAMDLE